MNSSRRLLASATSARGGNGLRPEPLALLPPIPLYRRLFRAHRKHLPQQMRVLGDEYIRHEFRAHRNVDNPAHLVNNNSPILNQVMFTISSLTWSLSDWVPDGVAALRPEDRRGRLGR